jgi:uncharacterized membrane-anchored protein
MVQREAVKPQPNSVLRRALSTVPAVTAGFWVTKVLTTGMGETGADFLYHDQLGPIALPLAGVGLVGALVLQFGARQYVPWIYWLAVSMVAVFGTMAADITHQMGVPLLASTAFYAVLLVVIFAVWYAMEKTLSFHSIYTRRREAFYWATVLATFALGTAAGDMTADTLNLGFLASGVMFAVAIAVPLVAYKLFGLNSIAAFWFAYVLTRPLGASFADWSASPTFRGGLDWGTGPITLVLTIAIVGLVGYYQTRATRRKDVVEEVPSSTPAETERRLSAAAPKA